MEAGVRTYNLTNKMTVGAHAVIILNLNLRLPRDTIHCCPQINKFDIQFKILETLNIDQIILRFFIDQWLAPPPPIGKVG